MVDNTSNMTRIFLENFMTFKHELRNLIFNRLISSSSLYEHNEMLDISLDIYTAVTHSLNFPNLQVRSFVSIKLGVVIYYRRLASIL